MKERKMLGGGVRGAVLWVLGLLGFAGHVCLQVTCVCVSHVAAADIFCIPYCITLFYCTSLQCIFCQRHRLLTLNWSVQAMSQNVLSLVSPLVPTEYSLDFDIAQNGSNFKANATVELFLNPKVQLTDSFKLHSKELVITNATLTPSGTASNASDTGGSPDIELKISYDKENDFVIFTNEKLSVFLQDNTTRENTSLSQFKLKINYIGKINTVNTPNDRTAGIFKYVSHDKKTIISTHCQPFYARSIYPCIDEPSVKTPFNLKITTPSKFKLVSASKISHTTGSTTIFERTIPLPTSLFGFTIGDLEYISLYSKNTDTKIPITIWSIDKKEVQMMSFALDVLQKYLPLLEKFFGCPFPNNKLDLVALPILNDMVMENFSMITIQKDIIIMNSQKLIIKELRFQIIQILVHELVHHWIGNRITFDSWNHLWFNESFATWLANYMIDTNESEFNGLWNSSLYQDDMLLTSMQYDSLATAKSIVSLQDLKSKGKTTNDLFDSRCYNKGIVILRSLQLTIGIGNFQNVFRKIFNDEPLFLSKSIKPIDIWTFIGKELKSENINNFFSSWTRLPGLPLLQVTKEDENNVTNLVQHRYFSIENPIDTNQDDFEDVPYHIPLFTKLSNNRMDTKNILMTDRSMKIDYPIALFNDNNQGYFIVSYEAKSFYGNFNKQIDDGTMTGDNLYKIFNDLSMILGNDKYQKDVHMDGLFIILTHISNLDTNKFKDLKLWRSLHKALELLEIIYRAMLIKGDEEILKQIYSIVGKLFHNLEWNETNYDEMVSDDELITRSLILFLHRDNEETFKLCQKILSFIKDSSSKAFNGTSKIPIELIPSVYKCLVTHSKTFKQWKTVSDLHKKSNIDVIKHRIRNFNKSGVSLETLLENYAMESLGFVTTRELVDKALNFITSNITMEYMDTVFIGLLYHCSLPYDTESTILDAVWEIFQKNQATWTKKLGDEGIYFIQFWVVQMRLLADKLTENDAFSFKETLTDVKQDPTTRRLQAISKC